MPIFFEEQGKYKKLKIAPLNKERSLQQLVEENLFELLEMHVLASEYSTTFGGRIDTLAVDADGAPVIIEYKLNKNENIINQGLSYLLWLKAQKVEFFEMLVIKKLGKELLGEKPIDWNNPKVICIAENYSKYDLDTVQVVPLRIELYKYHLYEKGIFSLELLNTKDKQPEKDKSEKISTKEAKAIEASLENKTQTQELFNEFRSRVLQMDEEIFEKKTSKYFAYRVSKNFAEVHLSKNTTTIKMYLRPIDYDDPLNMIEKVSESYKWTLDRRIYLKDVSELDYVMKLVEQSYKDVL